MSPVQRTFFTAVVAVTGICLIASFAASAWVDSVRQQNIAEAEWNAQNTLEKAGERLRSDADPEGRISEASQLAQEAVIILQSSAKLSGVPRMLSSILPSSSEQRLPSAALAQRAQTLTEALADTTDVLPIMKRLAGYDASTDVGSATGSNDLYLRLYTARDGLQKTINQLDMLPRSEWFTECQSAAEYARTAFGETEPLLKALEMRRAIMPDTARFVSAAQSASLHASRAVTQLLSEEHIKQLAELSQ